EYPSFHADRFAVGIASMYAAYAVEFIAVAPYRADATAFTREIFGSDRYRRMGGIPALTRRKSPKQRRISSSVVLPLAVESRRIWKSGCSRYSRSNPLKLPPTATAVSTPRFASAQRTLAIFRSAKRFCSSHAYRAMSFFPSATALVVDSVTIQWSRIQVQISTGQEKTKVTFEPAGAILSSTGTISSTDPLALIGTTNSSAMRFSSVAAM